MMLVFKREKYSFLLESVLLKHLRKPGAFRHLLGDAGATFLLIAGGMLSFRPQVSVADQVPVANTSKFSGLSGYLKRTLLCPW